jgi:predicted nuclease of predicted toxin-antitoxin system
LKLLLDQNLSVKLIRSLEEQYPGTSHVVLLGLHKADDSEIWYYARYHGFTLATKNTDMVDLCVLRGAPPKVLWLRIGNCTTAAMFDTFARNRDRIGRFEHDQSSIALSLFRLAAVE